MILGRDEILRRLRNGDIFRAQTWDEECLREASYALRIVNDGLLIDGTFYDPGVFFTEGYIGIEPGKIAILSTKERMIMPADLVGKIGIRLEYALQGLTGLMGIQVDPLYGHDKKDERLFIRVANFGNESIRLSPGDKVFTFELHDVAGDVPRISKECSWPRIKNELRHQSNASWSYVTRVNQDLSDATDNIQQYLQPLVMFGVFLVAVTILGVVISLILRVPDSSEGVAQAWISQWERILLLSTLTIGAGVTAWIGSVAGWRILRPYRINRPKPRKRPWWKIWQFLWPRGRQRNRSHGQRL